MKSLELLAFMFRSQGSLNAEVKTGEITLDLNPQGETLAFERVKAEQNQEDYELSYFSFTPKTARRTFNSRIYLKRREKSGLLKRLSESVRDCGRIADSEGCTPLVSVSLKTHSYKEIKDALDCFYRIFSNKA